MDLTRQWQYIGGALGACVLPESAGAAPDGPHSLLRQRAGGQVEALVPPHPASTSWGEGVLDEIPLPLPSQ